MRQECGECFPCQWLQRKPLVSNPSMHHDTCVMHVPWCITGLLTHGGGENIPGSRGASLRLNFMYLSRSPLSEPMLTYQPLSPVTFNWGNFMKGNPLITNVIWKLILWENKLIKHGTYYCSLGFNNDLKIIKNLLFLLHKSSFFPHYLNLE